MKAKKPPKKTPSKKPKAGKAKKKSGYLIKFLKFLNILFILLILFAYASQYISPAHFTWIAFIGLAYPTFLIANLFFILLWMILRRRMFIYSLIALLLGYNVMFNHVHIAFRDSVKTSKNNFKILSYNVDNFRYNLKPYEKMYNKRDTIVDFILKQDAQIACFQEFFCEGRKDSLSNDSLIKNLNYKNYYYQNYITNQKYRTLDAIAIFTNYEMINKGFLTTKEKEKFAIFTDLIINLDTVRLYNVHLTSIHLGSAVDSSQSKSAYRLWKAFKMRAYEVDLLKTEMAASPYPIILCGDFNDTPASYSYHQLSANLMDTFNDAGSLIGNTYNGKLPPIRIDYIFHNKMYECTQYNVQKVPYSDHYPVTAEIVK